MYRFKMYFFLDKLYKVYRTSYISTATRDIIKINDKANSDISHINWCSTGLYIEPSSDYHIHHAMSVNCLK